jgi:hypothetical protein
MATRDLEVEAKSEDWGRSQRCGLPLLGISTYLSGLLLQAKDLVDGFVNIMLTSVSTFPL